MNAVGTGKTSLGGRELYHWKDRFILHLDPAFFKNMLQAQLYAQYPSVEIHEVDDYTRGVYTTETMSMWGCYFGTTRKPYAYPIKNYIDYGLKPQEKEEKVEPMAAVLEYLSSVGKGEQIWIQIIVRAHRLGGEKSIPDLTFGKKTWKDAAKKEIDKIMKRDKKPAEGQFNFGEFLLTKGERTLVEAMERNTGKLPFDCGIRGMYIARNENFNAIAIPGLIGSFRQYSSADLNGIAFYDWTDFDYPWQDFRDMRKDYMKRKILAAYKARSFFHEPYKKKHFVLSGEELATIFHLPGKAVGAVLNRVVSESRSNSNTIYGLQMSDIRSYEFVPLSQLALFPTGFLFWRLSVIFYKQPVNFPLHTLRPWRKA